jgi:hypothetical protein
MGLLSKIFGGKKQAAVLEMAPVECPHSVLVPRWESVQDMGIADKATRYMCEACKQMFTPAEANQLRETLAARVTAAAAAIEAQSASGDAEKS